jgi:hypothetical protein
MNAPVASVGNGFGGTGISGFFVLAGMNRTAQR